MKPMVKKLLFTVLFVICTLVLPITLLLVFVDAENSFSAYVVVFGVIIFGILGYITISVHGSTKEIHQAVEEMKLQNAAIAYKLTHGDEQKPAIEEPAVIVEEIPEEPEEQPKKVNLNPADPLDFN